MSNPDTDIKQTINTMKQIKVDITTKNPVNLDCDTIDLLARHLCGIPLTLDDKDVTEMSDINLTTKDGQPLIINATDGYYPDAKKALKEKMGIEVSGKTEYVRVLDPEAVRVFNANGVGSDGIISKTQAEGVTDIGRWFRNNINLKDMSCFRYFTNVKKFYDYSFGSSDNLEVFAFPDTYDLNIEHLNSETYWGSMSQLERVYIKDIEQYLNMKFNNDYVGNAFYYAQSALPLCNGVSKLYLYDSVEPIVDITIPSNISIIKHHRFYNYKALNSLTFQAPTVLQSQAFSLCEGLKHINGLDNIVEIGKSAFMWCRNLEIDELPENVILGDDNPAASDATFYHCEKITITKIPDNITSLRGDFIGCYGITSINFNNVTSAVSSGYPYLKKNPKDFGYNTGGAFMDCVNLKTVVAPKLITAGAGLFMRCTSLESASLPVVEQLYDGAFHGCSNLQTISLPKVIKIFNGGTTYGYDGAFLNCTQLQNVILGSSLQEIGKNAFKGCSKLSNFKFEGSKEQWSSVILGDNWKQGCPFTVVHCSDGDVAV